MTSQVIESGVSMQSAPYSPGLEGVIAAQTAISSVDGQNGEFIIRGFSIEDFASHATFEDTVYLLWHDALPVAEAFNRFSGELAALRTLEPHTLELLRAAAARRLHAMDALRMACASLSGAAGSVATVQESAAARLEAMRLVAAVPVIVAAYHRLSRGLEPVAPREDLPHTANFLYMLHGSEATGAVIRALDTYWNTVSDHGLNASTFTARVIVSTGSDVISAVTGAVGALKGPLHGGAPGPALDLVFEIGRAELAEQVLREKLERGERLMGSVTASIARGTRGRTSWGRPLNTSLNELVTGASTISRGRLKPVRSACCRSTSLSARCRRTSSSTLRYSCTVSGSQRRFSPRCSLPDASRAGPPIASNRSPPTVSSVPSRNTSVPAIAARFRPPIAIETRSRYPNDHARASPFLGRHVRRARRLAPSNGFRPATCLLIPGTAASHRDRGSRLRR